MTPVAHSSLRSSLVHCSASIADVLPHMVHEVALVVDDDERLCGLLTDGDLRRAFLDGATPATPVSQVMTVNPVAAPPGLDDHEVRAVMIRHGIRHLPITDEDGRPVALELIKDHLAADERAEAVVMAGGLGTRLRPLTLDTPKPLLRVGNQTILDGILDTLHASGVEDVVLTVNYLGDKIRDHVEAGDRPLQIGYVEERERLGTAGSLALLDPRPSGSFLVLNADLITEFDFRSLIRFHRDEANDLTVCVRRHSLQIPYGVIRLAEDCRQVRDIAEKPEHQFLVNAGIYMLEPALIDLVPRGEFFDMTQLMQAALEAGHRVGACPVLEYWRDVGEPEQMQAASREWHERRRRHTATTPAVPAHCLHPETAHAYQ